MATLTDAGTGCPWGAEFAVGEGEGGGVDDDEEDDDGKVGAEVGAVRKVYCI